ncbi:hypothetical protein [Glutamicibacter sp.]|uniref:hypothetical protein n=1 Tax=Glutamicibacter sp. TaxID=1931995 RepID=UPI002B490CFF|nr:hypothetical protein [Glutamicibacter sp.]HJX78047.1 hypothetical protein [Glutamicibacter sp.]
MRVTTNSKAKMSPVMVLAMGEPALLIKQVVATLSTARIAITEVVGRTMPVRVAHGAVRGSA